MIKYSEELRMGWKFSLLALLVVAVSILPDVAYAAVSDVAGDVMCSVALSMTGNLGRGLATIAVAVIGISAMLGRVTWLQAVIVIVGIACVFGAASIMGQIENYVTGVNTLCVTV